MTPAIFALLAASAIVVSGLFPWRAWPSTVTSRRSLGAAGIALATLYPLGLYLLVRGYELGDGRYPHPAFSLGLGLLGAAVAFGAAFRAQAAATKREYFAEVAPAFGGFALMSIAIGTPLGVEAGLIVLATASALIACIALLPEDSPVASLLALGAAAGLPPGVGFGARVLGIEATFEAGDFSGLIGLVGAASWAIWAVASARAVGLAPAAAAAHGMFRRVAAVVAASTLIAGPALGLLAVALGDPVTAEVMRPAQLAVANRFTTIATTTTVLPALSLFLPLLLIAAVAYPGLGATYVAPEPRAAVLRFTAPGWWWRVRETAQAARVPDQYRSLLNLRELELAATGGRPLLWLAALVALGFAVTR